MTDPGHEAAVSMLLDVEYRTRLVDFPRPIDRVGLPGLYAWFVDQGGADNLADGLGQPLATGLIYAGEAGAGLSTATLRSRIGRNHIAGNITGSTFRLTLAAILAAQLGLARSLGERALAAGGETALSRWMADHLEVSVAPIEDRSRLAILEALVLHELNPPLNLQGMSPSPTRSALTQLRRSFSRGTLVNTRTAAGDRDGPKEPAVAVKQGVPDVGAFLIALVGHTIPTLSGRPNRILEVEEGQVVVGTTRSPGGQVVDIARLQRAADRLFATGEMRIDVATLGYRSAFFGAVLAALPGTRVLDQPRRVVVVGQSWPPKSIGPAAT